MPYPHPRSKVTSLPHHRAQTDESSFFSQLSQLFSTKEKCFFPKTIAFFLFIFSLTMVWADGLKAETPATAPAALKDSLTQIDAAANRRDIGGVIQFYSDNFRNSDGLTRKVMEQVLKKFWENYPQLNYRTELQSWQNEGNAIVAETITYITGSGGGNRINEKLESTLRSRQRYENQKIVYSEILAEASQISAGANPPKVQVNLPQQVRINEAFAFDAIVQEPLGDDILLGTALEEAINPDRYSQPSDFELELLPGGGIFKEGIAPLKPESQWISAVLIRADGTTTIIRRLPVVNRTGGRRN